MTTAQKPEVGTAVATRPRRELAPEVQARVDDVKARNMMVAAIRGTQWGNNIAPEVQRSIAEYCRQNNLDPVRHVEVLGGRIYLTAELYDEKGAQLIRSGEIIPDEPDYIHVDERLEKLATAGDAWAIEERTRRERLRIQYAAPEAAKATVVQRFTIPASGAVIVGVNWCGGVRPKTQYGKDADPIGEAEPAKTAQTRARRRAWKQIADVIPGYAELIRPLEATAKVISEQLPVSVIAAPHSAPPVIGSGEDPYTEAPASAALPAGDEYQDDTDLAV